MSSSASQPESSEEWIRLPKPKEKCPITGLPRSTLVDLLNTKDPKTGEYVILQFTKKRHGKQRGIRMINRASLLDYQRIQGQKQCSRQFKPAVRNPYGYTVDQVCESFDLWGMFADPEDELPESRWSELSRAERIQILDRLGLLIPA